MDPKKNASPSSNISEARDLNDVELIGSPNSPRSVPGRPEVHHVITNEINPGKEEPHERSHPDSDAEAVPTEPLLPHPATPDRDRQKPPLAGPEIDDLDGDERPTDNTPYPGIDDGLLDHDDKKPNGHGDGKEPDGQPDGKNADGDDATEDGKWWPHGGDDVPDFPSYGDHTALYHMQPYGINGIGPGSVYDHERPISPMIPGTIIPDVNTYQQKKNLAQGMMDLALLSANANQLRYVLESSSAHPYYYPSVAFISLSIILQIAVGVGLILNSRYNVKDDKDICKADKINNMTVLGVFLVTIVNVFITSFSVATPNTTTTAVQTVGSG